MDIKIVTGFPEKYLDAEGLERERLFYSFVCDGTPALKWYPECAVPGRPKDYYVRRCINRLLDGRSSEAFGAAPAITLGDVPVEAVTPSPDLADVKAKLAAMDLPADVAARALDVVRQSAKAGRGSIKQLEPAAPRMAVKGDRAKPVTPRPTFRFVLDGVESEQSFPTEREARAACAMRAFLTRHKLGQIPTALAKLQAEFTGSECRVWACAETHGIRATVDGEEYSIGWVRVGETWAVEKFKKFQPGEIDEVPTEV